MGIKQMQGTSAYLEYVGPKGRKRKKDCVYNKDNTCHHIKSQIYLSHCVGRMYCSNYDDSKIEENKNLDEYQSNFIEKKNYKRNDKKSKNKEVYLSKGNLLSKTITLLDTKTNEIINIKIVEEKEKDILSDKISIQSPLGRALCKTNIGSEFEINQEGNVIKYILKEIF